MITNMFCHVITNLLYEGLTVMVSYFSNTAHISPSNSMENWIFNIQKYKFIWKPILVSLMYLDFKYSKYPMHIQNVKRFILLDFNTLILGLLLPLRISEVSKDHSWFRNITIWSCTYVCIIIKSLSHLNEHTQGHKNRIIEVLFLTVNLKYQ